MLSARPAPPAIAPFAALILLLSLFACDGNPGGDDDDEFDSRSTDVVLVEVSSFGGLVASGEPYWITDRDGYDNQPAFSRDGGRLLFSSQHGLQADIYRYVIENDELDRATLTLESEFSPLPLATDAGFSCVRVEQDGRQRIWAFDPESDGPPRLVLPSPDYVGYFAAADDGALAVYVLGKQSSLYWVEPPGELQWIADSVGRSIQAIPGTMSFSYSVEDGSDRAWIHAFDRASGASSRLTPTLTGSRDHAWLPDGTLLMARDAVIYAVRPLDSGFDPEAPVDDPGAVDGPWVLWLDLTESEIEGITRIAVSPAGDRLALVVRH